jgi:hypothetical protein
VVREDVSGIHNLLEKLKRGGTMDVLQYLMTKDLQDILGPEWNPMGTQKWYKEMLDFELESYKRRTTEDLQELKSTLENAVREHRWHDLEYGTLDPLDVVNWRACRDELARRKRISRATSAPAQIN